MNYSSNSIKALLAIIYRFPVSLSHTNTHPPQIMEKSTNLHTNVNQSKNKEMPTFTAAIMSRSASLTYRPWKSVTSAVNLPLPSTGFGRFGPRSYIDRSNKLDHQFEVGLGLYV